MQLHKNVRSPARTPTDTERDPYGVELSLHPREWSALGWPGSAYPWGMTPSPSCSVPPLWRTRAGVFPGSKCRKSGSAVATSASNHFKLSLMETTMEVSLLPGLQSLQRQMRVAGQRTVVLSLKRHQRRLGFHSPRGLTLLHGLSSPLVSFSVFILSMS